MFFVGAEAPTSEIRSLLKLGHYLTTRHPIRAHPNSAPLQPSFLRAVRSASISRTQFAKERRHLVAPASRWRFFLSPRNGVHQAASYKLIGSLQRRSIVAYATYRSISIRGDSSDEAIRLDIRGARDFPMAGGETRASADRGRSPAIRVTLREVPWESGKRRSHALGAVSLEIESGTSDGRPRQGPAYGHDRNYRRK